MTLSSRLAFGARGASWDGLLAAAPRPLSTQMGAKPSMAVQMARRRSLPATTAACFCANHAIGASTAVHRACRILQLRTIGELTGSASAIGGIGAACRCSRRTPIGRAACGELAKYLHLEPISAEEGVRRNGAFLHPAARPALRDKVFDGLAAGDFDSVVLGCYRRAIAKGKAGRILMAVLGERGVKAVKKLLWR